MRYADALRDLLAPLGVYRLSGGAVGGELEAQGAALDACGGLLEEAEREMLLTTAEGEGLEAVEELLPYRPVTRDPARRRAALAALLRVGGDSFTLDTINDNLTGCGLNAVAAEIGTPGQVEVRFPEVPGIPEGFEAMRRIIEDILPCHLGIAYVFWYATWAGLERRFAVWDDVEGAGLSWEGLEKLVDEEETI